MTSDCIFGCFNLNTDSYYCMNNVTKVGTCCPAGATDTGCIADNSKIFCSNKVKIPPAKYLYCLNFHTACQTDENVLYATALNYTVYSDRMSDRDFSCWWQLSLNDSLWDAGSSKLNLYVNTVQNMVLYMFTGVSRDSLLAVTNIQNINTTTAKSYQVDGTQSIYLAAVPNVGQISTELFFSFNVEGSERKYVNAY